MGTIATVFFAFLVRFSVCFIGARSGGEGRFLGRGTAALAERSRGHSHAAGAEPSRTSRLSTFARCAQLARLLSPRTRFFSVASPECTAFACGLFGAIGRQVPADLSLISPKRIQIKVLGQKGEALPEMPFYLSDLSVLAGQPCNEPVSVLIGLQIVHLPFEAPGPSPLPLPWMAY